MSSSCPFAGSPLCFLMKAATVQEITSQAKRGVSAGRLVCIWELLFFSRCVLIGVNALKIAFFLEPLDIEREDECASDTWLSLATSYTEACTGNACARERVPSPASLNLTVLIRWWSVIHCAPCLPCARNAVLQRRLAPAAEHNNLFRLHASPRCHRRSLGAEEHFHMDPLPSHPLETRWRLIVLNIFMSG